MLATFSSGALGFGVHYLATLAGEKGEPIVLGFFVAIIGNMLLTDLILIYILINFFTIFYIFHKNCVKIFLK